MFIFPDNAYTDVRIEDVYETNISYTLNRLDECKEKSYKAAFIRMFDGDKWYYSAITDCNNIQNEIDSLYKLVTPNEEISNNKVVEKYEINNDKLITYDNNSVSDISLDQKKELLTPYFDLSNNEIVKEYSLNYVDRRIVKEFYSSKGSSIKYDIQDCGYRVSFVLKTEKGTLKESFNVAEKVFDKLISREDEFKDYFSKCKDYVGNAKPVVEGNYTVVLSPEASGVFAHESFGHKSEADFMVGDETMKKEWVIGKNVGTKILSIVDTGKLNERGYTPFDDEGTKATKTYLIKEGKLTGRLHSTTTAVALDENVTGNARAMNFEYEPIVRMTNTYIEPGTETFADIISNIKEGIYIDTIKHGSGMSTFTIAPNRSYWIKDGKICDPVNVSVISGTVFDTLSKISAVSKECKFMKTISGGCGKMEQYPLPVGIGGPYVKVDIMKVQ